MHKVSLTWLITATSPSSRKAQAELETWNNVSTFPCTQTGRNSTSLARVCHRPCMSRTTGTRPAAQTCCQASFQGPRSQPITATNPYPLRATPLGTGCYHMDLWIPFFADLLDFCNKNTDAYIYGPFLLLDLIMHFRDTHTHTQTAQTQQSSHSQICCSSISTSTSSCIETVIWYKEIGLDYFVANGNQVVMHLKPQPKPECFLPHSWQSPHKKPTNLYPKQRKKRADLFEIRLNFTYHWEGAGL